MAIFTVGMEPQRMVQRRFRRPYLRNDICGVATSANRVLRQWADIDKPGVLVGVQAGTFMAPVMGAALKRAENMPDGGSRFHIRLPPRVAGETRPTEVAG